MQACYVTISTTADGNKTEIVREGEMDLFSCAANIAYVEENARVSVSVYNNTAKVVRQGDYTLRLNLEEGKITVGSIGVEGAEGEILIKTHEIAYRIAETFVVILLRYDLLIGDEKQEMSLRLLAYKE